MDIGAEMIENVWYQNDQEGITLFGEYAAECEYAANFTDVKNTEYRPLHHGDFI